MKHLSFLILCSILLSACGGGGGSSGGGGVGGGASPGGPPPVVGGPEVPSGQKLTLTQLSLDPTDVLAETADDVFTVASFGRHFRTGVKKLAYQVASIVSGSGNAYAQGSIYPPVKTLADFLATKKYENGSLFSLDPVVKYLELDEQGDPVLDADGLPIELEVQCDLSSAELKINRTYVLNLETEDMLIEAEIPDTVNADCLIEYRSATLAIMADDTVFDLTEALAGLDGVPTGSANIDNFVRAKDTISNSTNDPLIIKDGQVYVLELGTEEATLTQLTADGVPLTLDSQGRSLAYNGEFLLAGYLGGDLDVWYLFEKDNVSFRLFRRDGREELTDSSGALNNWVDSNGRLMVDLNILNTEDLSFLPLMSEVHGLAFDETTLRVTYTSESRDENFDFVVTWLPSAPLPASCYNTTDGGTAIDFLRTTDCQYEHDYQESFDGTYGDWIYSSRGLAWNSRTFESTLWLSCWDGDLGKAVDTNTCTEGQAAEYSALYENNIWIVGRDKSVYLKYDLDTKTAVYVNLDDHGYIALDYDVFNDVVLVESIFSSTSNKEYIEVNLDTGEVTNQGVIAEGGRVVINFIPVSSSI